MVFARKMLHLGSGFGDNDFGQSAVDEIRLAAHLGASRLDRALNDDTFRASLEKIGFPVFRPRSPAAIAEFIDADRARWSKVIKAQNITLD